MTIMGTGTSVGVPMAGCECEVCLSTNPKNHRYRSGVLVRAPRGNFLIDTGPELRLQLVREKIRWIHAVLFTHAHADHILGLDDLRIFGFRLEHQAADAAKEEAERAGLPFDEEQFLRQNPISIPLYCEEVVESSLRDVFSYAFADPSKQSHRYATPRLRFETIHHGSTFDMLGLPVTPIRLKHGELPILGFRIGNVAFCTDVSTVPAESRDLLRNLDVLIIDALRYEPHPTHLSVDGALKVIRQLEPRQAYLTHMSHSLDYDKLCSELPSHVRPAFDGLEIEICRS
ncbi:MAG: MBL fold metallo-hydrolase [Planctomycetaceae bacterium]|nr:MBL fold metallo-hydrolase [Planctomycetaceae bacterium]